MRIFKTFFLIFIINNIHAQELDEESIKLIKENSELLNAIEFEEDDLSKKISGEDISVDDQLVIREKESTDLKSTDLKKFGYDIIDTTPTSITTTSDLPIPNEYNISLGDELRILLTGGERESLNLKVGLDGTILFPEIGSISVYGETLESVRDKLEKLVSLSYVGTNVSVGINKLSARKINIVGAVKNPGTYIVNPFSTITSALAYSGGFEDYASLREIVLIRSGEKYKFDLYEFLVFGQRNSDINLQQGDTILVNSTNKFIEIKGAVNRPMIYEYKANEEVNDLIRFSMGLNKNANPNKIAIIDYSENLETINVREIRLSEKYKINNLSNPISVEVFDISSSSNLDILARGPLENQGFFKTPDSGRLQEILEQIKFTTDIYAYVAVLQNDQQASLFSVEDIGTQNLIVTPNSEIIFFSKNENILENEFLTENAKKLLADYQLNVVLDSDNYYFPFIGEIRAQDVINFFGFKEEDLISESTRYFSPYENLSITKPIEELTFFARKDNILNLQSISDKSIEVSIVGEVFLPGTYNLPPTTTLKKLYDFVQVLDSADEKSVIFTRKSIYDKNYKNFMKAQSALKSQILITSDEDEVEKIKTLAEEEVDYDALARLSGELNYSSDLVENLLLEDGDEIFIPKRINLISVIGEVYNPSTMLFEDGMKLRQVIELAGGVNQQALDRQIYVIRSNGKVIRSKNIFNKNIEIEPGDTIVVPTDYMADRNIFDSLIPVTQILSNLAFSAAAIDNLKN